jgi:hypothetical protein
MDKDKSIDNKTNEHLVQNIKQWIKLDNDITKMKAEITKCNKQKKDLTGELMKVMKENEIDCFDINGGALIYKKSTVKKPINAKSLLAVLRTFYKSDLTIAEEVAKFVLDSREEQIKETLKRKINS